MTEYDEALARLRLADPVTSADPDEMAELWSKIDEEVAMEPTLTDVRTQPVTAPTVPWYRRPLAIAAAAAFLITAAIVPFAVLIGGEPDVGTESDAITTVTVAPTTTTPAQTTVPPVTTMQPTTTLQSTELVRGFAWTELDLREGLMPDVGEASGVTWTGSGFVAVGWGPDDCARIWFSPDGSAWEPANLPDTDDACGQLLRGVEASSDLAIAYGGGFDRPLLWMSENGGSDWHEVPDADVPFLPNGRVVTAAGHSEGFAVAANTDGDRSLWYTTDLEQWTLAELPAGHTVVDVAAGSRGFVAVARGPGYVRVGDTDDSEYVESTVLVSRDGLTWSLAGVMEGVGSEGEPCGVQLNTVAGDARGYIAAGICSAGPAGHQWAAWHSADGLAWTQAIFEGVRSANEGTITHSAGASPEASGYLLAGYAETPGEDHATVWFSSDGATWIPTELVSDSSSYAKAVALHDGVAVAVGRIDATPTIWLGLPR